MSPASSSTPSTAGSAATASGNCKSKTAALTGNCLVVAWDLDTTGRRLIDEICQIGAYTVLPNRQKTSQGEESSEGKKDEEETTVSVSEGRIFSQYVMPYRNPNPGARRSFGIKVQCCRSLFHVLVQVAVDKIGFFTFDLLSSLLPLIALNLGRQCWSVPNAKRHGNRKDS